MIKQRESMNASIHTLKSQMREMKEDIWGYFRHFSVEIQREIHQGFKDMSAPTRSQKPQRTETEYTAAKGRDLQSAPRDAFEDVNADIGRIFGSARPTTSKPATSRPIGAKTSSVPPAKLSKPAPPTQTSKLLARNAAFLNSGGIMKTITDTDSTSSLVASKPAVASTTQQKDKAVAKPTADDTYMNFQVKGLTGRFGQK